MHFHARFMLLLISGEEEDNRIRVYVLEGILIMVPDEGLEAQIQEETGLCHKLFRVGVQSPRVQSITHMSTTRAHTDTRVCM